MLLLLFRWHVLRHARRHWLLALLNILAVALGVAVFVAVQVANGSAARAFEVGVDLVAGKAQLEVRGKLDDSIFPAVQHTPGVRAATPVIEELATLPDYPGEFLRLLGIDPFRTFEIGGNGSPFDIERWLSNPNAIANLDKRRYVVPSHTLEVIAWTKWFFRRKLASQRALVQFPGRPARIALDDHLLGINKRRPPSRRVRASHVFCRRPVAAKVVDV